MSKLTEQLKELQRKQLKVEFFQFLKKSIGEVNDPKYKEAEKEVKDQIFAFIDAQIDMIESGEVTKSEEISRVFSDEQFQALALLADKVANKTLVSPNAGENPYGGKTPKPAPQAKPVAQQDKVSFALQHRHLENKEVKVKSLGGAQGKIVGLDAPNVVAQLVTGQTVETPLGDIII